MMNRRDFLKLSVGGAATLVLGTRLPFLGVENAFAATQTLEVTITDALKEMVTHNSINDARCYFWIYKMKADGIDVPADCPGPTIVAVNGDSIQITVKNELDEAHSFYVPGMYDSGPIPPGGSRTGTFTASVAGAHLYYDNLNEPVNRVMGLHGALVVRPAAAVGGHRFTPYDTPTAEVQKLYDDFGNSVHFPGLAWEQGDQSTHTPAFRQYVWLTHQASPNLFAEVGNLPAGQNYNPQQFITAFLKDTFSPTRDNRVPQFFTINGQSGFFSHFSPYITPMGRVGEPVVVHILNAGLWTHSMHLHANHFYVTSINGVVSSNPIWLDVFNVKPMDRIDYTIPYMRPPDIPNARGIGYPDTPRTSLRGTPVWPPVEELDVYLPGPGEKVAKTINGQPVDLKQRMSPLCFPMHDHSEPSQTAQGGNYNCGLISGIYFTGDRNTPGQMNFPMDEDFAMMYRNVRGVSGTGRAPGTPPE